MATVDIGDLVADARPVAVLADAWAEGPVGPSVDLAELHADIGGGSLARVSIADISVVSVAHARTPAWFAASSGSAQWIPQSALSGNGTGEWL
jgi:hypothetical protein